MSLPGAQFFNALDDAALRAFAIADLNDVACRYASHRRGQFEFEALYFAAGGDIEIEPCFLQLRNLANQYFALRRFLIVFGVQERVEPAVLAETFVFNLARPGAEDAGAIQEADQFA